MGVATATPPPWALVLRAAKEWGIPPWVVERECTPYWWERVKVWWRERAKPKPRWM